jgi:HK97 family phage portal protein
MNIFQRIKLALPKNGLNEYAKLFLSGENIPLQNGKIDENTALTYTAVWACVKVLSETLATLPLITYKKDKDGKERVESKLADMLHYAPNPNMTAYSFKETQMLNLVTYGNSYAQKRKNSKGEVIELVPIQSDAVKTTVKEGVLYYNFKVGTQTETFTREEIFHIPAMSFNGYIGMSPIELHARTIGLGKQYEIFANQFLAQGTHTSGVVTHPGVLKDEAFNRLKKEFAEQYQGLGNSGKPVILEDGMEFKELGMKLADAQFLESRKFQTEEIARIYRMPLHMIQDLSRATNNNIEHQSLEFVTYTMLPWIKRFEENVVSQLFTEAERNKGYFAEFNISALLRGDIKSRYEAYALGRLNGWLSVNDILRFENMNRIKDDWADKHLQPLNYVNTDIANDVQLKNTMTMNMIEEIKQILGRSD